LIFIDENKARKERMDFDYDSTQGTWKTKGINGVIRPWFFQKVVDMRPGRNKNVLFQSKEDPVMQANIVRDAQRPTHLIHATFWENVHGILENGIVPAANPSSSTRQPFKDLLQGAENHVYTSIAAVKDTEDETHNVPVVHQHEGCFAGARSPDGRPAEPPALPEEQQEGFSFELDKAAVGLEKTPDAFFVIDAHKAEELGIPLDLVQCPDREDHIYVQGAVPKEVLTSVHPNNPVDIPDNLKASIVDPHSFEEIPVIDMSLDKEVLVEKFRFACEVVGFMQIVGHEVSEDLQREHMELQKRFFELPEEIKRRLALTDESPVRGYFGRGGEDLDQVLQDSVDAAGGQKIARQTRVDNKEALDTNGVPWSKPRGGYVAGVFGKPSQLPSEQELAGFRAVLEKYSAEMFRLSRKILSYMALVLNRPPDFFDQFLTQPVATHRLLHYWPITDFNTQIGVGEHTDYGLLTVLKQDNVGGLQVLNARDKRWVHCCPLPNAFVVNIGDMLARWTAHRFKSTVHRVLNVSALDRYSVPYFLEPNMDCVIVPGALDTAEEPGDEAPTSPLSQHRRRCRLRQVWKRARVTGEAAKAEDILERFYRASGQLKPRASPPKM
jgi:isopenicillin N synthase-like dioxygenase